jgi:hypothetical protein
MAPAQVVISYCSDKNSKPRRDNGWAPPGPRCGHKKAIQLSSATCEWAILHSDWGPAQSRGATTMVVEDGATGRGNVAEDDRHLELWWATGGLDRRGGLLHEIV